METITETRGRANIRSAHTRVTHVGHGAIGWERQFAINELTQSCCRRGGATDGSAYTTGDGTVCARPSGPVLGVRGIVDSRVEIAGIGIDGNLVSPAPDTIVDETHAHATAHLELQASIDCRGKWPCSGAVAAPELREYLCEARRQVVVGDGCAADGPDGLVEEALGGGNVNVLREEGVEQLEQREAAGKDHLHEVGGAVL